MGGSVYLVIYVESASRWMRPHGMRSKSETVRYVTKFVADKRNMGRPALLRYGQRRGVLLAAAT